MKNYKNRVFDSVLRDALDAKGAVLIEGAKWCGKTTTAEQIAKSVIYLNLNAAVGSLFNCDF